MIDVSQWRASIGLWNYFQVSSSRPANGHQCHSFKGAVDSKSDSITSVEKTTKLPVAIVLPLLYLCYPIPPPIPSPSGIANFCWLQSIVLPGAAVSSSSNLICFFISLIVHLLLLLSGNVELNPGPTIDDQPVASLLTEWLQPLVNWKPFGLYLPGLTQTHILRIEAEHHGKIEDEKIALYSEWLKVYAKATWEDVITALRKAEENAIAQNIENHMESDVLSTSSSPSPTPPHTPNEETEIILLLNEEKNLQESLKKLVTEFAHIMRTVKTAFRNKVEGNSQLSTEISNWVEGYLHLEHGTINNDLDDIFKKIYHYYDFIDCSLIVDMCAEFLNDKDLMDILKNYSKNADKFRSSQSISELKEHLRRMYRPFRKNLNGMPLICIELHNPWNDVSINGLYLLINKLLPKELRESLMKHISIDPGSVIIKLNIITADGLIEYAVGKSQFMCLIGIFCLDINDQIIFQKDKNRNFTFKLALLQAVTVGHNEAVEFLLQLETVNIDHTNEEGKTALILACERRHEDIVHSLLSAGANVNLQDNNGVTALMTASEHNHISIINMLQQANAKPYLKTTYGSNALMTASLGVDGWKCYLPYVMLSPKSLLKMALFCIIALYTCDIMHTFVTLSPKYNPPIALTVPKLLKIKILRSTVLSFNILLLLMQISTILAFNMPYKCSFRVICQKPSILLVGLLAALLYKVFMFYFIYQVYAIELVSTLQLTLVVPSITLVLHSFFQMYVLISDYSPSDFNKIYLVVSLMFNYVMTNHTVCMTITSICAAANPSSNIMLIFAAFEIYYRLWAAARYTVLLKMSFAKSGVSVEFCNAGAAQAQVCSSERNDVLVVNGNDTATDDAFEYQIKSAQETSLSTPFVACSKNNEL